MKMSVSCSYGSVAIRHDNREYTPPNANKDLAKNNEYLIRSPGIEKDYERIFGDALTEYNARQKRKDRCIDNYYDKIKNSKNGEKLAYEYVLQVGDKDSNTVGGQYEKMSKEIYRKYVADFEKKNPNLRLINASIHCDETHGTPHLHVTVVPVSHSNRGLSLKNSLSGAMKEMGFDDPAKWCIAQQSVLEEHMKEYDIERDIIGCHREHIKNGLYQELKDKVNAELQFEMHDKQEELSNVADELQTKAKELLETNEKLERSKEIIEKADTLKNQVDVLEHECKSRKKIIKALEKIVDKEEYKITTNGMFGGKNAVIHITVPKEQTEEFLEVLGGMNFLTSRYETQIKSLRENAQALDDTKNELGAKQFYLFEKENDLKKREQELAEKEKLFSDPEQSIENLNDKIRKTELELADTKLQVRELSRELSRKDDELERAAYEYNKLENLKNEEIDDMRQTYENALEDHKTTIAELCTGYEVLCEQSEDKTFKRLCESMKNIAQKYVTKNETWASGKKNFIERFKRILPKKSKNLER